VHARSVVAAAIDGVTGELFRARLTPDTSTDPFHNQDRLLGLEGSAGMRPPECR
jgi:hypothetical protein